MNSKLAKSLRKTAKAMAISANVDVYRLHIEDEKKQKFRVRLTETNQLETIKVADGMITNSPYSIRGIYRGLKKQIRQG